MNFNRNKVKTMYNPRQLISNIRKRCLPARLHNNYQNDLNAEFGFVWTD